MDLYQLLGVRRSASVAEIRRAFQKAARQLHPDLNPGDPVAANRFRAVSEAFDVLVDAQRRAAYDRGETRVPESAVPEIGFEGFDFSAEVRWAAPASRTSSPASSRSGARPRAKARHRGEDLEESVRITFDESLPSGAAPRCTWCASTAARPARERGDGPSVPWPARTARAPGRCAPIAAA